MAPQDQQSRSAAAWALAEKQHGVVTHGQLRELGFSAAAIKHRLANGRLHRLWRGVYAVGRRELSPHGWWTAAVLACGDFAVLSHWSAAQLWQLLPLRDGPIHVSVIAGHARRRRGIVIHRRLAISDPEVTRHFGIPVTTPACTLIDLASHTSRDDLEALINEADKRDRVDPDALRVQCDAAGARAGTGRLRDVLDERTFTLTDSELERRFLPIARAAGLPQPLTQAWLNGFRVDFYWPDLGLVVETDGLRYHRTPAQQARDRVRDQAHTAAGHTVLRFTRAQVRFEPDRVKAVLTSVARRHGARLLN